MAPPAGSEVQRPALDPGAPAIETLAPRAAWGEEGSRQALREMVAEHPRGAPGDHAALALAAVLVEERRWQEALPLARRAATGTVAPHYARLLLARVVVEGGLSGEEEESRALLIDVLEQADAPGLRREARFRALQLAARVGAWGEAAGVGQELLAAPPPPEQEDEARWLTAESLRLSGQREKALEIYQSIWLRSPGSPWALQARDRLVEAGIEVDLAPGDRLLWIEALQAQGLHREALAALQPLLAGGPGGDLRDQALFLSARSHFVLRQNQEVTRLAGELARRSPASRWAARGAMQAIRALAREGRSEEIRQRERWLRSVHPGGEETHEARFFLGVHLAAQEGEPAREGEAILREVAASGGSRAPDALWRLAWVERRRGATGEARRSLERLLGEHPGTGFRPAALYWLARFQDPAHRHRAVELYQTVRREAPRDYYGLLAEERLRALGEPLPALRGSRARVTVDPLRDQRRRPEPSYHRGVELRRLGLLRFAAAELEALPLSEDPALDLATLHLRARHGDTWGAMARLQERYGAELRSEPLGSPGVPQEVWEVLYPFPYREAMIEAAARRSTPGAPLDPWLAAALARNESRFWAAAASPAGAVGLLQLMPETAARTARRIGLEPPGREGLFDPGTNLEIGVAHLAELLAEFDGAWAPALAAYNAGLGAARRWWRERPPEQPLDEWIESIPFAETRLYVKRVLGDQRIYREQW
jgi:soluble lytic murein transglycosylase